MNNYQKYLFFVIGKLHFLCNFPNFVTILLPIFLNEICTFLWPFADFAHIFAYFSQI